MNKLEEARIKIDEIDQKIIELFEQRMTVVKGGSTVSYLDKTVKKGVTYTYTVKAYYGKTTSYYNTKGLTIKDER